ncbi:MAG: UDP-N-acetylglucosamine 1-carboxyvinyltransferase [Patescibacteria group bacterium]
MSNNTKETFVIQGLNGKQTLSGSIAVHGAKNAALKAMAAAVLFDGPVTLENIPDNADVGVMGEVLSKLGASVQRTSEHSFIIDPSSIATTDIDAELAQNMRSSVVLTGPLLARFGKVSFPAPGGCVIGTRPIDLFVEGYKKMGATVNIIDDATYDISVASGVAATEIFFNIQSVGGTETLMMAAVLGTGTTILRNCAMEPEIVNVAEWLNAAGADIQGVGTTTIIITGTGGKLLASKVSYRAIPDRIEAASFLIMGALSAREITIENCEPRHMEAVIHLLQGSGVEMKIGKDRVTVKGLSGPRPFNVRTHEYPGFPTDIQAPIVTYLTQATGESTIFETIFEGRFKYVEDLSQMGASITVMNPREILIKGATPLRQLPEKDELRAHDIRAGFAVVLAAIIGTGTFTIHNIHLIDRGYERLEERLSKLGVGIVRKVV